MFIYVGLYNDYVPVFTDGVGVAFKVVPVDVLQNTIIYTVGIILII